jgi:hypothetical protein
MSQEHQKHIEKLEKHIEELSHDLTKLGNTEDLENLRLIIHRPGWTTLPEIAFASGIVESLHAQTKALAQLMSTLIKASESVGVK